MADEKASISIDAKSIDESSSRNSEVFNVADIDTALAKKTAAINDAIDQIGLTGFHWKLFCLNGFGYAVDSVGVNPWIERSVSISSSATPFSTTR